MSDEELQTMVLASKEINSLMPDRFTLVMRCKQEHVERAMTKLKKHFQFVDLIYACNGGIQVQARATSGKYILVKCPCTMQSRVLKYNYR